jgi:putative FmdB family regulatory protein
MPTYEYKCRDCGHCFEMFQSMNDEPIRVCPKCSGKVQRLIGKGACLIFKGSGFYATDHRSEAYKTAAKADKNIDIPKKTETSSTKSPVSEKSDK